MESYTDMKYSDCGCSGRCRKVSGNRNQSVRSCLDPAMQAGSGVRYPQMGNQMNDGMPQMIPETGNNWENNGNFGWNRMRGWEGNAFCPGSMPGMLEKDYPLAMAMYHGSSADALWTRAWLSPRNHLFRAGPGL